MLGHRLGQRGSALDVVGDGKQRVFERAGLLLFAQNRQAAEDGQAGILQGGQLAGELDDHLLLHTPDGEALALLLTGSGAFFLAALFADPRGEKPQIANLFQGVLGAGGVNLILDLLPGLVHRFVEKSRHDPPTSAPRAPSTTHACKTNRHCIWRRRVEIIRRRSRADIAATRRRWSP
jgi:hypothetical protein